MRARALGRHEEKLHDEKYEKMRIGGIFTGEKRTSEAKVEILTAGACAYD